MTDLVLKELKLRHATLDLKAERLRCEWRATTATSPKAAALGKQVKSVQADADAYAAIIEAAGEL
ncbi:hypothetical protein ACWC0A_30640 [Streptomyces scopuliridis]